MLATIRDLCAYGERQGAASLEAARYIEAKLSNINIRYKVLEFQTAIPRCVSSRLLVDNIEVAAKSCSFTGGIISFGCQIITSLQSSQLHFNTPNINYNPKCLDISTPNYYAAPAMAIDIKDLEKVRRAKTIESSAKVVREEFLAKQILAGNLINPDKILFCHFDSLFTGAVDNASGVAVLLHLLQKFPELSHNNLFVFDGNEELSYDSSIYWGHGYRVFEERHADLLETAKQILIVDCLGYESPVIHRSPEIIKLAFPIKSLDLWIPKIKLFSGGIDKLMECYHSPLDNPSFIDEGLLIEAFNTLCMELGC